MKYLTGNFQECQGHKQQRNSEKLSQTGGDQEDVMIKCNVLYGIPEQKPLVGKTCKVYSNP